MKLRDWIALAAAGTLLVGCFSPDPVRLTYSPNSAPSSTSPNIQIGTVTDARKSPDTTYLGEIRSGWGTPMKSLRTPDMVVEEIRDAFEEGLKTRGQLGTGQHRLDVKVIKFDCNQFVRREAHADFEFTLTDRATSKVEYTSRVVKTEVQGSVFAFDVAAFASVEDLRAVANEVLQEAVDGVLDDPGFRSHLTAEPQKTS